MPSVERATWPERLDEADFIVVTRARTESSKHMVNADSLARAKSGVRVIIVGRRPLTHEAALEADLQSEHVTPPHLSSSRADRYQ